MGKASVEESTSKVYVGGNPTMNAMTPSAGSALFVINLCASLAPVATSGKNLPGLENYRLYQVARNEDGRTRHRLRLGFFTSQSHAERVLTVVRQQYPTAFTACLCDEDRKFVRGYLPESASTPPSAPKRPIAVVTNPASPPPQPTAKPTNVTTGTAQGDKAAPKAAAVSAPPAAKATAPAPALKAPPPAKEAVIEVSRESKPAAQRADKTPAASAAEVELDEFSWEPPALKAALAAEDAASTTAKHPVLTAKYKTQPVIKAPTPTAPEAAKPPAASRNDTAASMRIKALDLTYSDPPAPTPVQSASPSSQPFHVAKGVSIGELPISLQADAQNKEKPAKADPVKTPSSVKAPASPPMKAAAPSKPPVALTKAAPPAKAAVQPPKASLPPPRLDGPLPDLDSTQTIRALTSAELNDEAQDKWFAIQLAASEQPVNLDTMPHLDIFEAYRLYSVAIAGSGKIVHSLRLGFFKEAVSAEAVSGYLKTFFGSPSVLRISVAEHARFKDAPAPRQTASTDESRAAKIVELSDARAARPAFPP